MPLTEEEAKEEAKREARGKMIRHYMGQECPYCGLRKKQFNMLGRSMYNCHDCHKSWRISDYKSNL